MRRRPRLALAALALLAACARGVPEAGPPEIHAGADECDHCRMILSDPRFAAAAVDASGETARFDDLACLLNYLAGWGERPLSAWVQDYDRSGWLRAEAASFVRLPHLPTPMGSHLVAVSSRDRAEELGREGADGEVLHWRDLLAAGEQARGRRP